MGIFRRDHSDVQQASAATYPETAAQGGQLEQQALLMPPFMPAIDGAAAPGVVPPPAAPMYSMRPPESAPGTDSGADAVAAETMRMASTVATPATRARRRPLTRRPLRPAAQQPFDPKRCAQAGLLKLAWRWQEAGAPIRAIHTYMQVLTRYPHTAAAAAAVADLVELSEDLARHGHFHIALGIYEELEELL